MSDPVAENEARNNLEPAYDASDPKEVNRARQKASRRRSAELDIIRGVMTTQAGRAWFYRYLGTFGVFQTPFTAGQTDTTAFKSGLQHAGHIMQEDIMRAAPDLYMKMCQEGGFADLA